MKHFSQLLHNWYDQNYRELPWRSSSDPYLIWISEIILQQTRVIQGTAYYFRFIEKWPGVKDLAAASEQEVLKMWQGLGYYSRARNLLSTAQAIANKHQGIFPSSSRELMDLKGIGKYTAAAIASNAFNEKVAVVDGNVQRFVTRLQGITSPLQSNDCFKSVQQFVDEMIDEEAPGKFNQAMMEFGALHCTPQKPDCNTCPFSTSCYAFKHNVTDSIPVKKQKINIRTRHFNFLIFMMRCNDGDFTYLQERAEKDIWKGLYQFPLIETEQPAGFDDFNQTEAFNKFVGDDKYTLVSSSRIIKHQLTHQTLLARFFVIKLSEKLKNNDFSLSLVNIENLGQYPLPRLIDRYLQQNGLPT